MAPSPSRKKTPSIKKQRTTIVKLPVPSKPAFQDRRTLSDHVQDNMMCAGRKNYFQRIIYVIQVKENTINIAKEIFNQIVMDVNKNSFGDTLTG